MTDQKKKTILYVDDEAINLEIFAVSFSRSFKVITAISGEEGLEKLKENPEVVVVISDMRMPGMNGVEFIKEARKVFPELAYFILTGYDYNDEISDAIEKKIIYKYFSKPFELTEIETTVNLTLNS